MADQWWSWALTGVGLTCFVLSGRHVWWAWYVGIAGQGLWLAYALITGQVGFLVGVVAYSAVYIMNAHRWTREHLAAKAEARQHEGPRLPRDPVRPMA